MHVAPVNVLKARVNGVLTGATSAADLKSFLEPLKKNLSAFENGCSKALHETALAPDQEIPMVMGCVECALEMCLA